MAEIQVVGAAIINGDKILGAQRSKSMKTPLKWEFVGGKVEIGETPEEALEREVFEELGVKINVKDLIGTGTSETEGKKINLSVFIAEIIEGIPVAKEHSQIMWIHIEDVFMYDWAEADIPICRKLLSFNK